MWNRYYGIVQEIMGSVSTRWACKNFHLAIKNVSKSPKKALQMWFYGENEMPSKQIEIIRSNATCI